MGVITQALTAVPVSVVALFVLVRYAPAALLTLLAGVVAVFSGDRERGRRAVTVLRILRTRPRGASPPGEP
jgi:hypothetical protein